MRYSRYPIRELIDDRAVLSTVHILSVRFCRVEMAVQFSRHRIRLYVQRY